MLGVQPLILEYQHVFSQKNKNFYQVYGENFEKKLNIFQLVLFGYSFRQKNNRRLQNPSRR